MIPVTTLRAISVMTITPYALAERKIWAARRAASRETELDPAQSI
jgi:hypothetical protein